MLNIADFSTYVTYSPYIQFQLISMLFEGSAYPLSENKKLFASFVREKASLLVALIKFTITQVLILPLSGVLRVGSSCFAHAPLITLGVGVILPQIGSRLYLCKCGEVTWLLLKYCMYCVSAPSLHRESTDSLIMR